jgi:AcrR family transcriptional regulator
MGVKERKERDKEAMRDMILQSAHQLFVDRGFEEVSIRNIAEAIEYSPATIYLYFKDKNDIYYAIQGEAFKIFNQYMAESAAAQDPLNHLIKMGEQYVKFAHKYPAYYKIMFIAEAPMLCDKTTDGWQEGDKALRGLEAVVQACIEAGRFRKQPPRELAFTVWSYVHGMCSLVLTNRMKHYPDDEHQSMMETSFGIFVKMLSQL